MHTTALTHTSSLQPSFPLPMETRYSTGPALSGRPGNGAQLQRKPPLAIDAIFYDTK